MNEEPTPGHSHLFWKDGNPPGCMTCGKTNEQLHEEYILERCAAFARACLPPRRVVFHEGTDGKSWTDSDASVWNSAITEVEANITCLSTKV